MHLTLNIKSIMKMKKNLLYFIISLGIFAMSVPLHSQAPSWQWASTGGAGTLGLSYASAIETDNDGNSYITGLRGANIVVQKFDASGTLVWTTSATGNMLNKSNDIELDNEGNIYITGTFYQTCTFGNIVLTAEGTGTVWAAFVAKLDNDGNFIWVEKSSNNSYGQSIHVDTNSDLIIAGAAAFYDEFTMGGLSHPNDELTKKVFLAKLTNEGAGIWVILLNAAYNTVVGVPCINQLVSDEDGNIYGSGSFAASGASGGSIDFGGQSLTSMGWEAFLMKTNGNGEVQWVKQTESASASLEASGQGVGIDSEGNIYWSGWMEENISVTSNNISFTAAEGLSTGNLYIAKFDQSGGHQWSRSCASISCNYPYEKEMGMQVSSSGNVYIVTYAGNYEEIDFGNDVTTTYSFTTSPRNYVVKINNEGVTQWAKVNTASFTFDKFRNVALDSGENCYVAGDWITAQGYDALPAPTGDTGILVLKLGNNAPSIINSVLTGSNLHVYPNPAQESIQVNHIQRGSEIQISDLNGKILDRRIAMNDIELMRVDQLPDGMYLMRVENKNQVSTIRFIVQH